MRAMRTHGWLLWLVLAPCACSRGGGSSELPALDLSAPGDSADLSSSPVADAAPPRDAAASDAAPQQGLGALPDGVYHLLATTSRLEHVGAGNPDRCPVWSGLFFITKAGASIKMTGGSPVGFVRETMVTIDVQTGAVSGRKTGNPTIEVSGSLTLGAGGLSLQAVYHLVAPSDSTYVWSGALQALAFGATALPAGVRRERLTWTDASGFPDLNTVDLLKDAAGNRFVSLPWLVGSESLAFATGQATYTPLWACAGPTARLIQQGTTIQVTGGWGSSIGSASTTLPVWFR